VPFLLAVFSALLSYSINQHFGVIGNYIKHLEKQNKPGGEIAIGWEHFFEKHGRGAQTKIRIWFWVALIVFTGAVWMLKVCG
jgi:hypothetical protein